MNKITLMDNTQKSSSTSGQDENIDPRKIIEEADNIKEEYYKTRGVPSSPSSPSSPSDTPEEPSQPIDDEDSEEDIDAEQNR